MKQPLLSICIPTYNRCTALEQSLKQYVNCAGFDDTVEIVISDNASTDNTESVARYYSDKYPNIKYYRNSTNIKDSNFELALKRGTGKYLKLQNDTTLFTDGALEYIKSAILSSDENVPIFFTNDSICTESKGKKVIECNSFDEYVRVVSTFVTAISCFGVWKSQLDNIKDFTKYTKLMLNQDDWTYQLLEQSGKCTVYNDYYYKGLPKKSGGYHWFQVHLDNYYKILQPYVDKGLVSEKTIKSDKKILLKHFTTELKYIYIYPVNPWKFEKKGTFKILYKYYKNEWYFYALICAYPALILLLNPIYYSKALARKILHKVKAHT